MLYPIREKYDYGRELSMALLGQVRSRTTRGAGFQVVQLPSDYSVRPHIELVLRSTPAALRCLTQQVEFRYSHRRSPQHILVQTSAPRNADKIDGAYSLSQIDSRSARLLLQAAETHRA